MIKINENYKKLQASYLFVEIARRVSEFQKKNPDKEIMMSERKYNADEANASIVWGDGSITYYTKGEKIDELK